MVEDGCCSSQESTVPNAPAWAPSVPITGASVGIRDLHQEPCCKQPRLQAGPREAPGGDCGCPCDPEPGISHKAGIPAVPSLWKAWCCVREGFTY